MKRDKNWWKAVDLESIESEDDCVSLMFELDEDISSMKVQVDTAKGAASQHGEFSDYEWFSALNNAMRSAKRMRQAVQERRGYLARIRKKDNQSKLEVKFIEVARKRLAPDVFYAVMNEAQNA